MDLLNNLKVEQGMERSNWPNKNFTRFGWNVAVSLERTIFSLFNLAWVGNSKETFLDTNSFINFIQNILFSCIIFSVRKSLTLLFWIIFSLKNLTGFFFIFPRLLSSSVSISERLNEKLWQIKWRWVGGGGGVVRKFKLNYNLLILFSFALQWFFKNIRYETSILCLM